ncbi:MAG: radical SAM family heme chaperone HemW [Dehalococcoidia bacterium]|nr:radical SAM family heme chaperone HemW [Dehalococcoidia bacterium]
MKTLAGSRPQAQAVAPRDPLALYLHVPFCQTKCHYCDFNSYRGLSSLIPPFVEALGREINLWGEATGHPPVGTVFFGGGTPSLLSGGQIGRLLDDCRRAFAIAPDAEVSMEANPGTVDVQHLATYREAGVNRLSFGVQSLHDDELTWLGRRHSAEEARRAYRLGRSAGFDNINLDFILGLPGQPLARWRATLEGALELAPEHLSCYALTVEEETPLGKAVGLGRVSAPDSDAQADMYLLAEELLAKAGYEHYEVSNWAHPGRRCRHNLVYWRNGPYLGLGPGAHSHYRGWRFAVLKSPRQYIERLSNVEGTKGAETTVWDPHSISPLLSEAEAVPLATDLADTMIMGLRLSEGVSLADFRRRSGRDLVQVYGAQVAELTAVGLVELTPDALRLTPRGRLLGNEAFVRFLPD